MRFSLIILLVLLPLTLAAQDTTKHDPLLGGYFFANSVEVALMTDSVTGPGTQVPAQRFVDITPEGNVVPDVPFALSSEVHSGRWTDCMAGDVDNDGETELVSAWVDPYGAVKIEVRNVARQKPAYTWTSTAQGIYDAGSFGGGAIRLFEANLDGTPPNEIVVCAFMMISSPNGLVFLTALNVDTLGNFTQVADEAWNSGYPFDVAAGDLDGDGTDEFMHLSRQDDGSYDRMVIERYDYNIANKTFPFVGSQGRPGYDWGNWKRLKLTIGDFRHVGREEAVVSLTLASGNNGRQVYNYISYWGGDYPQFALALPGESPAGWQWRPGWESDAVAADLNIWKDDGDELVAAGPGDVAVIKFDGSYRPYVVAQTPYLSQNALESYERRRIVAVADVDADTSSGPWMQEIIVAEHKTDNTTVIRILAPTLDGSYTITGLTGKYVSSPFASSLKSEIAVGDFDGDATRLGIPRLVTKQFVYQPIVELNVPPTHFDYLGGQAYDVCGIYPPQTNQFKVRYTETQSQTSRFTSELSQSWGVSGEVSGGFSLFGVKVKAYVKGSYDRGYYGSKTLDTTITTSQMTESWGDDWILATVTDYDFWEYPLYCMGSHQGNVLVVIPHFRSAEWFPRRNIAARNWMADHEVGNIFSYVRKNEIGGWSGANLLTSFAGKTISRSSAGEWTLDLSSSGIDENKLTTKIGTEVGLSVSAWGIEASVSGRYSRDEISTHTSSATKSAEIVATVASTDQALGDADYVITPFMYWGNNGALVVDYAVDPSTLGDPVLGTFWDKHYLDSPDPGLILPWRLDSLKSIGGTASMKQYSTSLRLSPVAPSGGDMQHIVARIHNFSLKPTDHPVVVRFYLGDPLNGGTPIVGTGGLTDFSTGAPIPAQGSGTVETDWTIPEGVGKSARIYAWIDPENQLTEIHEDNNIGFVPLTVQDASGVREEPPATLPERFALAQNYPNPFNPTTVILYDVPERSHVTLTVYDMLGRTVKTLVNEMKSPGRHSAVFQAGALATGTYFYRCTSGSVVQTRKMLLIK